ncbi:hypothetical protein [Paenibacillus sp.]|uniref:hypothetical protein n=1 Tax=Paenibacillus sp. TaxID=58172 RepID=UPI0028B13002|nr:hypothetical protein [Paenibacillus sp.]
MKMNKKMKVMLGATLLVAAIAPVSAYAATSYFEGSQASPSSTTSSTAKVSPGTTVKETKKVEVSAKATPAGKELGNKDGNETKVKTTTATAKVSPGTTVKDSEKGEVSAKASPVTSLTPGSTSIATSFDESDLASNEKLTQMIDKIKKDLVPMGITSLNVLYRAESGQQESMSILLKDSTADIVAQIQKKINN